jgi:hypothetical protein
VILGGAFAPFAGVCAGPPAGGSVLLEGEAPELAGGGCEGRGGLVLWLRLLGLVEDWK